MGRGGSSGGGGGKGRGGGGGSSPTVEVKSRDIWGGSSSAQAAVNPVTQEIASNGGQLQNTRKSFADYTDFGKETTMKGFSVDRRSYNINQINRELRREPVKVKIHRDSGKNRIPFLDANGSQYYAEFA